MRGPAGQVADDWLRLQSLDRVAAAGSAVKDRAMDAKPAVDRAVRGAVRLRPNHVDGYRNGDAVSVFVVQRNRRRVSGAVDYSEIAAPSRQHADELHPVIFGAPAFGLTSSRLVAPRKTPSSDREPALSSPAA